LKLLIVDDEEEQRDSISSIVQAWGHETATATNGVEALDVIGRFAPAVIITDLKMPVMDGFELLHSLRESGNFPPTIVSQRLAVWIRHYRPSTIWADFGF